VPRRTVAERLRRKLDRRPARVHQPFVQCMERRVPVHGDRDVVQADVSMSIEGDGVLRVRSLPERDERRPVTQEHGGIFGLLGAHGVAEFLDEEASCGREIGNGEPDVVNTAGRPGFVHASLLSDRFEGDTSGRVRHAASSASAGTFGKSTSVWATRFR
jgi:hypothetical protein